VDRDVFVTREPGLADLQRRLAATQAAGGAVVRCEGEPGMGKTALAAELARRARDQSFVVASGSCLEGEGATAYRPWTQVGGALGGGVIDLITDPAAVGNASRFRIFDDVVEALRAVSAGSGMLVVLDDLHWADVASLGCCRWSRPKLPAAGCSRSVLWLVARREPAVQPNAALQSPKAGSGGPKPRGEHVCPPPFMRRSSW
jgi:AAA ATPase domain